LLRFAARGNAIHALRIVAVHFWVAILVAIICIALLFSPRGRRREPGSPARCPKCNAWHSMRSVSERTGGFSLGKAIIGDMLFGPLGLVGGTLGRRIRMYICMDCGYYMEQ
jgi:hypothetical protein